VDASGTGGDVRPELKAWRPPARGALFVVSGPSGVGKSTLLRRVFEDLPGIEFSVSYTTRAPRAGERDGVDYHFVAPEAFLARRAEGALLEHAEVYGTWYGTPRGPVEAAVAAGRSMILDIDVQGAAQVRRAMPEAVSIFLLPPSREGLHARLRGRGTDRPEVVERRMREAEQQLREADQYDYLVVNEHLETAVAELESVFLAELARTSRRADRLGAAG